MGDSGKSRCTWSHDRPERRGKRERERRGENTFFSIFVVPRGKKRRRDEEGISVFFPSL